MLKNKLLKSRATRNLNSDTCEVAQVVLDHIIAEGIRLINFTKSKTKAEVPLEEFYKNDTECLEKGKNRN